MLQISLGSQLVPLARTLAVVVGASSGLMATMDHIRDKRDVLSFVVPGTVAGLAHSLMNQDPTSRLLAKTLGFAVLFAVAFKPFPASTIQ
ncbi:hypothetical protein AALP_AA3G133600 [Arabis alpina]|uniref:Membrane transporter protein n=1 Tax=Arabis alpina TaxID=50452 RepID=A0A087H8Y9_ARAAL|nr:hypothetical protein AALP_AA3G133600 [Arabis alpina]